MKHAPAVVAAALGISLVLATARPPSPYQKIGVADRQVVRDHPVTPVSHESQLTRPSDDPEIVYSIRYAPETDQISTRRKT